MHRKRTYTYLTFIISAGAIVHTQCPQGKKAFIFQDLYQWPHDPNLTLTILVQVLETLETVPSTLYLRLDNCARENKNRYMLGFCSLLVDLGIFKKVSHKLSRVPYMNVTHDCNTLVF